MIEMGKKYKTRDGRDAEVYSVNGAGPYPVHGAVDGKVFTWTSVGKSCWSDVEPHSCDLAEAKEVVNFDIWLNVYKDGAVQAHSGRRKADDFADSSRVACINIKRDVEVGEGL